MKSKSFYVFTGVFFLVAAAFFFALTTAMPPGQVPKDLASDFIGDPLVRCTIVTLAVATVFICLMEYSSASDRIFLNRIHALLASHRVDNPQACDTPATEEDLNLCAARALTYSLGICLVGSIIVVSRDRIVFERQAADALFADQVTSCYRLLSATGRKTPPVASRVVAEVETQPFHLESIGADLCVTVRGDPTRIKWTGKDFIPIDGPSIAELQAPGRQIRLPGALVNIAGQAHDLRLFAETEPCFH